MELYDLNHDSPAQDAMEDNVRLTKSQTDNRMQYEQRLAAAEDKLRRAQEEAQQLKHQNEKLAADVRVWQENRN